MQLRRSTTPHSFENQIAAEKARLEAELAHVPHGPQRDILLKKIRQLETTVHLYEWLHRQGSNHQNQPSSLPHHLARHDKE
jgi:hypothetical protein